VQVFSAGAEGLAVFKDGGHQVCHRSCEGVREPFDFGGVFPGLSLFGLEAYGVIVCPECSLFAIYAEGEGPGFRDFAFIIEGMASVEVASEVYEDGVDEGGTAHLAVWARVKGTYSLGFPSCPEPYEVQIVDAMIYDGEEGLLAVPFVGVVLPTGNVEGEEVEVSEETFGNAGFDQLEGPCPSGLLVYLEFHPVGLSGVDHHLGVLEGVGEGFLDEKVFVVLSGCGDRF
jgi:hypothetical protein